MFLCRFSEDIKWMTGRRPNIYWQATWRYISPLLMVAVFLSYIVIQFLTPLTYETWDPHHVSNTFIVCQNECMERYALQCLRACFLNHLRT